ncbi:MAG: alpha-rhamnosidase [Gorillibacterium sp.]|nr:alpha-rhamnosidase [Gorillibacterium sp.]
MTKATWIWFPGDFEVWLRREVELRRDERGVICPPIWRADSPYVQVQFDCRFEVAELEELQILANGPHKIWLNGAPYYESQSMVRLTPGKYELRIEVVQTGSFPALYVQGTQIASGASWEVSCLDKKWLRAGYENFDDPTYPPSAFQLERQTVEPESIEGSPSGLPGALLVDFGRETFGYLELLELSGEGELLVYYGESREEALSMDHAETLDRLVVQAGNPSSTIVLSKGRALRYVHLVPTGSTLTVGGIKLQYEYLPVMYRGAFKSSNDRLNQIWEVAVRTFHLNTREFFLDGIKRDRWVWSGDAYQSYLMNYYIFFDNRAVKRTVRALRGKDPVAIHLNTILDYSFYWFIGLQDYYLYTGDREFIENLYDSAVTLMDFCLGRTNEAGMMEGINGDWVFIDWADMNKEGELSTEQMLFAKSLEVMAEFAELLGHKEDAGHYAGLASELRNKLDSLFWDETLGAYINGRHEGKLIQQVTKHPNLFAILYGYADEERQKLIKEKVMLNPSVPAITTPYMRFYELAALCELNEQQAVLAEVLDYWGGMLDRGATSFWEEYDPNITGIDQYAMYDRPFGKSLCHAWGASPLYLLGKYYLGVKPLSPGYSHFLVEPKLGGLEWLDGRVPLPSGDVTIYMDEASIKVSIPGGQGTLRFSSQTQPTVNRGQLKTVQIGIYELELHEAGFIYEITYQ